MASLAWVLPCTLSAGSVGAADIDSPAPALALALSPAFSPMPAAEATAQLAGAPVAMLAQSGETQIQGTPTQDDSTPMDAIPGIPTIPTPGKPTGQGAPTDHVLADGGAEPQAWGLLPFASPVALFQRFAPLRDYLNERLGLNLVLETARDFSVHLQRIEAGDYDLVLTAPHFVIIALDSGHYQLGATYQESLHAVFVVAAQSTLTGLDALAGQKVGAPPAEAVITIMGEQFLLETLSEAAGTDSFQPPLFTYFPSHNAALRAVTSGLVDAAVVSVNVARAEIAAGAPVRVVARTEDIPGLGILFHRRLNTERIAAIQNALITMDQDPQGRDVLETIFYAGYAAPDPAVYERFRPMLPQIRERLPLPPTQP